ncbi:MAG: dynamin family protein [Moraxellaceae bacterium]|nr:dynamin family protein [Moraxellaceae bacterium]
MDALAALSPVAGRAEHLREQGLFSRLWHSLTGKNQKLSAESDHALAQAQFAALRLIAAVQEKGVLTLEFTCALQNRIQGAYKEIERLGARHNADIRRVYRSMAQVYSKLREKLMEHDERFQRLERRTSLLEWISHPNMPRLHGKTYLEMPQTLRLACIVNDFFLATQGGWHVSELFTLQEMLNNMGLLAADSTLQADKFFDALQHDEETHKALLKSLAQDRAKNTGLVSLPAAQWLDDLRHHRLVESKASETAAQAWGYAAGQPVSTWSLALDLLYHMRAAGLTPLKHSELGQTKQHWLETLDVLDELVTESILPSAFSQEIKQVRKSIEGFKLTVPLIGKFSTGKSTLLNAWFGEDIQPKDLGPCTALATEFHYAQAGQEKLVVVRVPNSQTGVIVREELPIQSYHQTLVKLQKNSQDVIHLELHRDLAVLSSHPDIILVDTPGLESSKGEHERALAQYVEQSVVFILCVNRSHLGESESRFVDRLHSLGQDFAVLICQEDLINRSQRESVRNTIGEQAKIDPAVQLVRGCSAQDGDLAGLRDVLASFEQKKSSLFQQRFTGSVVSLVQRAENLIRQQLATDTNAQTLRVQQEDISQKMTHLQENFDFARGRLVSDCQGRIADQVCSTVSSFLHGRRSAYVSQVMAGQDIGALVSADAGNAFQLAVNQCLTPVLQEAARRLQAAASIGVVEGNVGVAQASVEEGNGGGMALGAVGGAGAGFMVGGPIGAVVGGVIGGLVGMFSSKASKEQQANEAITSALEQVISQIRVNTPEQLRRVVEQFLMDLKQQIDGKLQTESEKLAQIAQQLQTDTETRKAVQQKAEAAFLSLAKSLSVDPSDAEEQLNERGNLTEEVMVDLLNNINQLMSKPWLYLMDVSWLYVSDELLEDNERAFMADLADILGVEAKHSAVILEFALALKTKNMANLFREKAKLPFDESLNQVLEEALGFIQKDMVDVRSGIQRLMNDDGEVFSSLLGTYCNFKVTEWLCQLGDFVVQGQPIAKISYDISGGFISILHGSHKKVTLHASVSGILVEVLVPDAFNSEDDILARMYKMDEPKK